MDSIQALAKVYDSLSKGASTLDFLPSDITGDCAAQVQEVVRERISGKVTEKAISSALSCMNDGNRLGFGLRETWKRTRRIILCPGNNANNPDIPLL